MESIDLKGEREPFEYYTFSQPFEISLLPNGGIFGFIDRLLLLLANLNKISLKDAPDNMY